MPPDVILFPDFKELKSEVDKLRTELSMLVLEYDELRLVVCKNIEAAYMLAVGSLEYKVYEAECLLLRLKRKAELMQAKINRQEKVILSLIEDLLDKEFAEYKEKLRAKMEEMNAAIERSKGQLLSDAETKEIKKLYRRIVKAIHPDLHPDLDKAKIELFSNAVEAYSNGDLNTIRIIDEMVSESVLPEDSDGAVKLKRDAERLTKLIRIIIERIGAIKSEYPYTVRDIVSDPAKIAVRKAELEEILRQYEEMISAYNERINEMRR